MILLYKVKSVGDGRNPPGNGLGAVVLPLSKAFALSSKLMIRAANGKHTNVIIKSPMAECNTPPINEVISLWKLIIGKSLLVLLLLPWKGSECD
jgi:hypothetical protein